MAVKTRKRKRSEHETSPVESITSEEVVCDCSKRRQSGEVVSQDPKHYFICCQCAHLQHLKCYSSRDISLEDYNCNQCHIAEIEKLRKIIESKQIQIQAFADAVKRKQEEVKDVIMQMLWRHYCHLPGRDAPPAVQEACKLKFEGGKMVPATPAPGSWVQAVEANLADMMEACGKKVTDFVVQPEFYAEEMNTRVLMPMRVIAVYLVRRGAYKDSGAKRLGVLGEVLGLQRKGKFWKG